LETTFSFEGSILRTSQQYSADSLRRNSECWYHLRFFDSLIPPNLSQECSFIDLYYGTFVYWSKQPNMRIETQKRISFQPILPQTEIRHCQVVEHRNHRCLPFFKQFTLFIQFQKRD
jgi:hypothetical protein